MNKKLPKMVKKMTVEQNVKLVSSFLDIMDDMFNIATFDKRIICEKLDKKDNGYINAEISVDDMYRRITILLYPRFFNESLETQRRILLHELCHCITDELMTISFDLYTGKLRTKRDMEGANERTTSMIESILDLLLRGELDYLSKAYEDYAHASLK